MIRFLNNCFNQKVISTNTFSATIQSITQTISNGRAFVSAVTPQDYQSAFLAAYKSGYEYVPLVLRNSNGDDPVLQDITGNGYLLTMITNNCKRPDKAIKLLEFLYSEEGQRLVAFGIEGETYQWNEDHTEIKWTPDYITAVANEDNTYLSQYGLYRMTLLMNNAYIEKYKPLNGRTDKDIYLDNLKRPLTPYSHSFKANFLKIDTSTNEYIDINTKNNKVKAKWTTYVINAIKSPNNWEGIYNQAVSYANSQGLAQVDAFYSKCYNNTKALLGVEKGYPTHKATYVKPDTGPNGDFDYWRGAE